MNAKFESVEDDAGKVTRYARHANGGGLIAPGAHVEESARIGPMTYVEHGARVGSGSRVGHGSWIDREATVGDRTVIGDGVRIGRGTVVGSRAHVGSHSRIGSGVLIEHGVHLHADSTVPDGGAVVKGPRPAARMPVKPAFGREGLPLGTASRSGAVLRSRPEGLSSEQGGLGCSEPFFGGATAGSGCSGRKQAFGARN